MDSKVSQRRGNYLRIRVRGSVELDSTDPLKPLPADWENTERISSLNSYSQVLTEPVSLPDFPCRFNDAASSWGLDPTPKSAKWRHHNRRETSETTPHSFHLNLSLISLTFSPRWRPRPVKRHPPSDPVPSSSPPRVFPPTFPPLHPSLSRLSPTSRISALSGSQRASFSTFSVFLCGRFTQAPSKTMLSLWQSGSLRLGRLVMHGVRPMVPSSLLWDSLPSRLPAAGPVVLPHMNHPTPTCNAHQEAGVIRLGANTLDLLVRGLPLPQVPFHRTQ